MSFARLRPAVDKALGRAIRFGVCIVLTGCNTNQAGSVSEPLPAKSDPPMQECWSGDQHVNPDSRGRKFSLDDDVIRRVKFRAITLRICIREDGSVDRVLVVGSTGNTDADQFLTAQAAQWHFKPAEDAGHPVRSTANVGLMWNGP